jgi:glutathione synthase/RimK-type ligase-like ATP-grasp enzyme
MSKWLSVRSRHKSVEPLRKSIKVPKLAVYRHGSTTELDHIQFEINSVESVQNSSSKLRMKSLFTEFGVITPEWFLIEGDKLYQGNNVIENIPFPLIGKHVLGSRNSGNVFIKDANELKSYIAARRAKLDMYIIEKYYPYTREYRLHITSEGCFYACRKMIKRDTPKEERWYRNDSNCVWILEDNPEFDKPSNWEEISKECVKALEAVGLDLGGFDVRVESSKDKDGNPKKGSPKFTIIESNSACSLKDVGIEKYRAVLPQILKKKYGLECVE